MNISACIRRFKTRAPGAATLPPGLRLYVVGDVHGRLDLLTRLENEIERDLGAAPSNVLTIFVGDYVDRGGDSRGVIEKLSSDEFCTRFCALRGNHEQVLLDFLSDASVLENWRKFGALETLHSYGVDISHVARGKGYDLARSSLIQRMPERHRQFLENTRLSFSSGDYYFCHAGARPGIALEHQSDEDLLWIRDDFLAFKGGFGKVVVHGHTPNPTVDMRKNRINVDTGAYASGVLTALVLEGETRRILSTDSRTR
ncbi:hypothetical protein CCR94_08280 [Rhodoblastus sphagnicola]|uniref:Calcineurin-like phosphoesterase domain-containing protein n=2 Tax=Rhodoblastus sphagnicola TaxID=333368 RepID=A0A2S6NAL4_9HYPH|nr:hypothetical protein CCR94_08280 [Rhodoblastus sphagnicola]